MTSYNKSKNANGEFSRDNYPIKERKQHKATNESSTKRQNSLPDTTAGFNWPFNKNSY